jgi:hypothetical protein
MIAGRFSSLPRILTILGFLGGSFVARATAGSSPMSFLPNGQVMALAHFEDKLVVAGHFCAQLRDSVAANIAAWDGSDWSLFGEGLDGPVYSLAVFNGDLIAAGSFASSSGTPLNFIARWEDGQWLPVGDGANESIRTLAVHDSLLVAGGYFSSPGRNVAGVERHPRCRDVEWRRVGIPGQRSRQGGESVGAIRWCPDRGRVVYAIRKPGGQPHRQMGRNEMDAAGLGAERTGTSDGRLPE